METQEIKAKIKELEEELIDVKTEKELVFKQTGTHVSSSKISIQMQEFTDEIAKLESQIEDLKNQLA